MSMDPNGYRFLRTGDESGDLCAVCDSSLVIDKTGKGGWKLRCQNCGRVLSFISEVDRDTVYV